ncbi:MAG: S8 family serine peptidase [Faecousia sp.]
MRTTKRWIAMLLAVIMVCALFPVQSFAENGTTVTEVTATEMPGMSRLEQTDDGETPAETEEYEPDELVTVIVQMEAPAVMEAYDAEAAEVSLSAGEAVSEFLTSDAAEKRSDELLNGQLEVLKEFSGTQSAVKARGGESAGFTVVAQWTKLTNAMAITIPYGRMEELKQIEGVRNVYVQKVYELPEDELDESDAGNAYYSYNMVGVGAAWAEGYTGEGMLVAVLDTGLDIEWSSYWDDATYTNVTGVRRVHEAFTEDSFMTEAGKENVRYTEAAMASFLQDHQINANTGSEGNLIFWDNNALYKNRKIPFAADYADGDLNVRYTSNDHGTHVAGTVAGYAEDAEGVVKFSGIAPDAQLLIMKVFSDSTGGAPEYAIVSALEDAAVLGADVMNLSLGSDIGFARDDTLANEVYGRLNDAGILFMISAGNSDVSSDYNNYGGNNLSSDPDTAMISAPAVYDSALSVASINSTVTSRTMLTWTDTEGNAHEIPYTDATGVAMKQKFAGQESISYNIIPVDGAGTYTDYYNAGFRAYSGGEMGIALVQRGGVNESGESMTFTEKINNATRFAYFDYSSWQYVYPIQAVLIYDNDPTSSELIYMSADSAMLTNAFLSGIDGAALAEAAKAAIAAGTYVTLTNVAKEDEILPWDEAGEMSEFSSWGAGPGLELKPEITAPGGNVWSSLIDQSYNDQKPGYFSDYTGTYGMMSGTSMSAPHMTGITALVMQYVKDSDGLNVHGREAAALLTDRLLVSTAIPQKNNDGVYYSPRQQGAGLVSVSGAMNTPAYITVEGQNVGKLELKDDPEKTGSYDFRFTVNNLTWNTLTYHATAVLLRPDAGTAESEWGERSVMLNSDVLLREVDLGQVTVPGKGNASVDQTVTLTAAEKAELDALFPNGTYVEGFVILTAENGTDPQIGLPFLGFYGDWTAAPIFDSANWFDEAAEGETYLDAECTWGVNEIAFYDGYSYHPLGENVFAITNGIEQNTYLEENITVSPNGYFSTINDFVLYQLRSAKIIVVEVKDAETDELYYRDFAYYQRKTVYDTTYGAPIPDSVMTSYFTVTTWNGTDLEGNVLPNGTECIYTLTAYGDGDYPLMDSGIDGYPVTDFEAVIPGENEPTFNGHEMDTTGDTISFRVLVDTEAPTLVNNAMTVEKREDGRIILSGTFQDEGSMASVQIYPQVKRSYNYDSSRYEYGLDMLNPFYTEMIFDAACHEWHFEADVTEYVRANESYPGESYSYSYEWTGNVFVYGGDYGGNDRAYAVTVNESSTADGLILSTTSALLYVGDEFDLNVINNTGSDEAVVRTSSDPAVATVDEMGHIVAVGAGQTTITISCGGSEVVCIVAVREHPTEITDFTLSMESFDSLKPNGTIMLKVTDIEPANAEITTKRWVAWEDGDYAEEVMSGLVNVSQYDTTGLAGEIYLNYSAFEGGTIPGGKGYIDVTLNNCTKRFEFSWEDLWQSTTQDDLVSDLTYYYQSVYVTQGETATLSARYNNTSAHSVGDVALCTVENYQDYSYGNVLDPAVGLKLDGPDFFPARGSWSGKLVNEEGYALPERIRVFTRYSYGYEYEMTNSWRTDFTYDNQTGEITVNYAPDSETSILMIRADGVVSEGNPAGAMSGQTYDKPEGLYGPFDWEVVSGEGELTTENETDYYGTTKEVAKFTPSEPGVSIVKATTKDGKYSVDFAVISQGVRAEELELNTHRLTLEKGETEQLTATLHPLPTLEKDARLEWVSYNESVATVDENGLVTAVAPGYAYLAVSTAVDSTVLSYCIVEVTNPSTCTVTFVDDQGNVLDTQTVGYGEAAVAPEAPTYADRTFTGWDQAFDCVTEDITVTAQYAVNTYTVSFVIDGEVVDTQTVAYGEAATAPEAPTYADRTFIGWDQAFDCVTEDITVTAQYAVNTYTVLFVIDGKVFDTLTVEHGYVLTDADYPELPAKEGYTGAWQKVTTPITGAVTVEAVYTEDEVPVKVSFVDVPEDAWYADAVDYVARNGLMEGVGNDRFDPEGEMTRAMLVTVLWRYAGKPKASGHPFTDVPAGQWYSTAIAWAAENGVVNGTSATEFSPEVPVTREQMVAILFRYANSQKLDTGARADLSAFSDADKVSAYAKDAMQWAVEEKIINGSDGMLLPQESATRAQVAAILMRYCELVK